MAVAAATLAAMPAMAAAAAMRLAVSPEVVVVMLPVARAALVVEMPPATPAPVVAVMLPAARLEVAQETPLLALVVTPLVAAPPLIAPMLPVMLRLMLRRLMPALRQKRWAWLAWRAAPAVNLHPRDMDQAA